MTHKHLSLDTLVVNRANDRHGELENETAAIAWLFNNHEMHMRNLAKDIAAQGQIFEAPLVHPENGYFTVFDGNRRVTCLKLLRNPKRAPTVELREYFEELSKKHTNFPDPIECQVEADRDRVDEILFRRHTGTQAGVGQSNWDDRMKSNFVNRTGKGGGLNVALEIEKRLSVLGKLPKNKKIPWSTMNRLLSAEPFRNRVGFTINKGRFELTHDEDVVSDALMRIAEDLAHKRITLNDVWDVDGKRNYLDELDRAGCLPTIKDALPKTGTIPKPSSPAPKPFTGSKTSPPHHADTANNICHCLGRPTVTPSSYLG
ncbi:MAG TPA: hypothetical protein VNH44_18920 [Micropepsaceae bacterium]|nr:hypothetical protein [Micropepsaceae bacterium]